MDLVEIEGKRVAMIIWNSEKEDDVHVYLGELQNRNGEYAFFNMEKGWQISLDEGQLSRIQLVTDDLKEMLLNADFALSMSISNLPETDGTAGYKKTGISWDN